MEILVRVFAAFTIILGAIECFIGFKSLKSVPLLLGFLAGASLGCTIGILSGNAVVGVIVATLLGVILGICSYLWTALGIISASICFGITAGSLLFTNILVGIIAGFIFGIFTLFFYKLGTVISSAFYGAVVIVVSAFVIMDVTSITGDLLIYSSVISIFATIAGITCQMLTTMYDDFEQRNIFETVGDHMESESFSEKRYPGLQRAYRNYCIKCGYNISNSNGKCPRCGFDFDD